ncbi:MAG TPA: hypothetical protein VIJ40_05695 [Acidimicrobiales bacterium]
MNTDMSTEGRFEDRLLAAILDDFDNLRAEPKSPSLPRWNRFETPSLRRAVPISVGAAAIALAVASLSTLSSHNPDPQKPNIQTVSYVVDRLQAAVGANQDVLVQFQHAPDSQTGQPTYSESWSSAGNETTRTEYLNPIGVPTVGYVKTITPNETTTVAINYGTHTWSTTTYPFGSASPSGAPVAAPVPMTVTQMVAQLRADVTKGTATVIGPAAVDGHNTLELQEGTAPAGFHYTWVDPTTYLPVREIDTAPGVSATSDQAIQEDYRWLPNTAANEQLLTVGAAIPTGFTQVPPAPTTGN